MNTDEPWQHNPRISSLSTRSAPARSTQHRSTQEDDTPDLPLEIGIMTGKVKAHVFDSWTQLKKLDTLMSQSRGTFAPGNLTEEAQNTKPEAWLLKQADDLQQLWETLSTLEKMLDTARKHVEAVKARIP